MAYETTQHLKPNTQHHLTMGNFRQLKIWQEAKSLAVDVYKKTSEGKFEKDYSLKDQVRRASVSIASNIAEGDERNTNKEAIRFFYIANGSVAEVITQLYIAHEIGYIEKEIFEDYINRLETLSKQIKSIINYRKSR